ncbi:MAG: ABC transporter ATP-binding protein [Desulfatitalea sp.]
MLDIEELKISFAARTGAVQASDGISLSIKQGETLGLVGESGCGKTMVALSIMRLLPAKAKTSGRILFKGKDLFLLSEKEMREIRGREIAMIFEQPQTCLNPVFTVGDQIAEAVRIQEKCSRKASRQKALAMMEMVGIALPKRKYYQYPHEYSGGMVQRAMIAMALVLRPALLIADEPTISLDATIQAQIMLLLKDLVARFNTSLLLITHDLAVVAGICHRVVVLYAGGIVEEGPVKEVFVAPKHPYTMALLRAAAYEGPGPINGTALEPAGLSDGCRFHARCKFSQNICREVLPRLKEGVRCHLRGKI